ncbi:unnamed protein product [Tetraodon nigroviridis]|uniref:(spotted green pufferfish) hypothetical protein n=1 Tax=Tetraodon nigroviridis TaxID=99883 RepID=Q4T604_TETNG|nr:unnamed protein product [Tetraodon nigroviridis]
MPTDTRRVRGPELSQSPWLFVRKPADAAPPPGPRADGRQREQADVRPVFVRCGLGSQAKGSAYMEAGATKLLCCVYGPRETERKDETDMRCGSLDPGEPGQGFFQHAAGEPAAGRVPPPVPPLPDRGAPGGPGERRLRAGPRRHLCLCGAGRRRHPDESGRAGRAAPGAADGGLPAQPQPDLRAAVGRRDGGGHAEGRGPHLHRGLLQTLPGGPAGAEPVCPQGGGPAQRRRSLLAPCAAVVLLLLLYYRSDGALPSWRR